MFKRKTLVLLIVTMGTLFTGISCIGRPSTRNLSLTNLTNLFGFLQQR